MRIALDTETTGVDLYHAACPFFLSVCFEDGSQQYWEWPVDPKTRKVAVPSTDKEEINELINEADRIIGQNFKFDATALRNAGIVKNFPWHKVDDTLIAGHLLNSSAPKDLYSLAVRYLKPTKAERERIFGYEEKLIDAVKEARRVVQKHKNGWAIASKKLEGMPSVGKENWRFDYWLPKAVATHYGYAPDHPWHRVLKDYANSDTTLTFLIWMTQETIIRHRKLEKIYTETMKLPPISQSMEWNGVTGSHERLEATFKEYRTESKQRSKICEKIASRWDADCDKCQAAGEILYRRNVISCPKCQGKKRTPFPLVLPKNGMNNSLKRFVFETRHYTCSACGKRKVCSNESSFVCSKCKQVMQETKKESFLNLQVLVRSEKTQEPVLNKSTLEFYSKVLPKKSVERSFIRNLWDSRGFNTACSYMESYIRYAIDVDRYFFVLHPNLNQTGTSTLRYSSNSPNEQNISKKDNYNVRVCFGPLPGREWWSLDGKNLELRIPAYRSKQKQLIQLFEQSDKPPFFGSNHILNFSIVFEKEWLDAIKKVGPEKAAAYVKEIYRATLYQDTKNGGFSIQYGGGRETTDATFKRQGAYDLLKSTFNRLENLNQECIAFAKKHGYVETIPDRSIDPERGYPLTMRRDEYGSISPTLPLNYVIQGTACWWMRRAMVRTQEFLNDLNRKKGYVGWREFKTGTKAKLGYLLIMNIHDEIVLDFPFVPNKGNLPIVLEVKRLMELGGEDLGIPTPASIEYHPVSWNLGEVCA